MMECDECKRYLKCYACEKMLKCMEVKRIMNRTECFVCDMDCDDVEKEGDGNNDKKTIH